MDTPILLLRVAEAAVALNVSRSKGYQLVANGTIPSIQLDGCTRVPVDGLKALIASRLANAQMESQEADRDAAPADRKGERRARITRQS